MEKNQIKSLISEHSSQLHQLAYEKSLMQKKTDEITVKMQEITGIVAAMQYVEQECGKSVEVTHKEGDQSQQKTS